MTSGSRHSATLSINTPFILRLSFSVCVRVYSLIPENIQTARSLRIFFLHLPYLCGLNSRPFTLSPFSFIFSHFLCFPSFSLLPNMTSLTSKLQPLFPFLKFPDYSCLGPKKSSCLNYPLLPNRSSVLIMNSSIKKTRNFSVSCYAATDSTVLGDRLHRLVSEFDSLTEPIDRVKRLLDYAARLPPFDESGRSPGNRVLGCTTQVWLEVRMDENGRMRFRADSDSEITKGFISCLIWLLDGTEPEEVMAVEAEDLAAINVGLYGKAQSRVNTWHNVLISMQNRTKSLAGERKRKPPVEPLPSLVLTADGIGAKGSFAQAQILQELC